MFHADGILFKDAFGTAEMREIFDETAFVETFLEVEAALARAEAAAGLVPEAAAEEITAKASLDHLDLDRVEANVADIDLFTMAIIGAWKEQVGEAGEYIHWGATSQDISDTAFVLMIREAYEVVTRDLRELAAVLEALAGEHADTPMMGRTHHVHALPITFGLKAATWLDEVDRHVERLEELGERLFVLQFFGATGSLASLGAAGLEVQERLAEELDLAVPTVAWFAARDRLVELLGVLAALASTLARIAKNVLVLNREEIRELEEPVPEGKVGSSTMPHKANPVRSERTLGLAALVRGHAGVMAEVAEAYDERDAGRWYAEFALVPEAFLYVGRMLRNTTEVLDGLGVRPEAMERNMTLHGSLVTSEAVMMALADEVGRQTAHEVVHEHAMAAVREGADFTERLLADERVTDALSREEIESLADPAAYTGVSARLVERAVEERRRGERG